MMSAFLMESSSVIVAVERLRGCEVEISHARVTAPVHDLDNTVEWQGDATASLRRFRGDTVPPLAVGPLGAQPHADSLRCSIQLCCMLQHSAACILLSSCLPGPLRMRGPSSRKAS